MTTVADFHSTRYTSWCPERKDIDQWASTVAEGGAPQDCRFQPLTLLPEDHEDAEACNEYDYAACAEEDLDAYLESLPKSNRWTELEASCAWLDQANIRIEELDLTHGLPEHLVLNQPLVLLSWRPFRSTPPLFLLPGHDCRPTLPILLS
ncbi:unnamed protein product [Closterium sp. NIES-65]|nr:unnamed protein product [Closterium sp. NIES-65]